MLFNMMLLGLFIILGFLGTLGGIGIILNGTASQRWHTIKGVITSSEVVDTPTPDGSPISFTVKVSYKYAVGDKQFTSSRISFKGFVTMLEEQAQAVIDEQYPVGKEITIYHDPNRPEAATLNLEKPPLRDGSLLLLSKQKETLGLDCGLDKTGFVSISRYCA